MGLLEAMKASEEGLERLRQSPSVTVRVIRKGIETSERVDLPDGKYYYNTKFHYDHTQVELLTTHFYERLFVLSRWGDTRQATFKVNGNTQLRLSKAISRIKDRHVAEATIKFSEDIVRFIEWANAQANTYFEESFTVGY